MLVPDIYWGTKYRLQIYVVLGSLPKVKLLNERIHERCWKKQEQKPGTLTRLPPPSLQGAGRSIHGMCTHPLWQLPEITDFSCAILRNASNLEFETFPESSGAVAHCRNHCCIVNLPVKGWPSDQDKHISTPVVKQMVLCDATFNSRKRIAVRKKYTEFIPHKYLHQQLLSVVVTSSTGTRDGDYCSVVYCTITLKITAK